MIKKPSVIVLLIGLALVLIITGCEEKVPQVEQIRPVKTIRIGSVEELTSMTFPGKARAFNEVNLGFEVGGTIAARPVNKGDSVKAGQLLARLDPRDFQNELNAAEAEQERAKAHRDRIAQAAATGAVAMQELTNAEARLKVARAQVAIKKKALEDSKITAPFAGVISATYIENFQRVQAKEPVLRLLDETRLKFDVNIPENLISKVSQVQNLFVVFDAFPNFEIPARIGEIGTEASETTRTYPFTLYLDQPEGPTIRAGMAGKAYTKRQKADVAQPESFEVPVVSIFEKNGKSFVWTIDESTMTVHQKEVKTLKLTNSGIMVKGDLKSGDSIVTAGVHHLEEGQKVRFLKDDKDNGNDKEGSS